MFRILCIAYKIKPQHSRSTRVKKPDPGVESPSALPWSYGSFVQHPVKVFCNKEYQGIRSNPHERSALQGGSQDPHPASWTLLASHHLKNPILRACFYPRCLNRALIMNF